MGSQRPLTWLIGGSPQFQGCPLVVSGWFHKTVGQSWGKTTSLSEVWLQMGPPGKHLKVPKWVPRVRVFVLKYKVISGPKIGSTGCGTERHRQFKQYSPASHIFHLRLTVRSPVEQFCRDLPGSLLVGYETQFGLFLAQNLGLLIL